MKNTLPICNKCGRMVECVSIERDLENLAYCFKVQCHGEEEITIIPNMSIAQALEITPHIAFLPVK